MIKRNKTLWYILSVAILLPFIVFASFNWHYLYRHCAEHQSCLQAARIDPSYHEGGKEYFIKYLKRNCILKEMLKEDGDKVFTYAGAERKTPVSVLSIFQEMREMVVNEPKKAPQTQKDDEEEDDEWA